MRRFVDWVPLAMAFVMQSNGGLAPLSQLAASGPERTLGSGRRRHAGTEPTVTDPNAVLARINPAHPIGMAHLASPGGGGFGHPLERRLEDVELDLNQGLIDRRTVETVYGVVVGDMRLLLDRPIYRLDAAASERRRQLLT